GGGDVEVVVNDDRELLLRGQLEQLLEVRPARIAIDLLRELAHVDLADRPRLELVDLALDTIDRRRIRNRRAREHELGILLGRRRDPRDAVLLPTAAA